jgi:hypothetical protein
MIGFRLNTRKLVLFQRFIETLLFYSADECSFAPKTIDMILGGSSGSSQVLHSTSTQELIDDLLNSGKISPDVYIMLQVCMANDKLSFLETHLDLLNKKAILTWETMEDNFRSFETEVTPDIALAHARGIVKLKLV